MPGNGESQAGASEASGVAEASEANVTTAKEAEGRTIQAFVEMRLLNCDLRGIYQYETKEIPATGGKEKQTENRTRILIMPRDEEPQSMSIQELIDEINGVITSFSGNSAEKEKVKKEDIDNKVKSMGVGILETTRVQLRQLFLYIDKSNIEGNTKPIEYAFNFVILSEVKPDEQLKFFGIQKIGLAVYRTKQTKVIERMDLYNIDDLIES